MKEIKAFIHKNRIGDVVQALLDHGHFEPNHADHCRNISVAEIQSLSKALDSREQRFSVELGQAVIVEAKLELLCEDEHVDEIVALISETARTGRKEAGWIYITNIERALPIGRAQAGG